MTSIWILGASDPEMEAIETLLRACGERVEYATVWRDGVRRRVTPAEAYAPDVEIGEGLRGLRATAYMVECAPAVLVGSSVDGIDWAGVAITIDHHHPRDPGYGLPPTEFLPASSLGQVIAELARLGRLPAWPEAAWPYRVYGRPRVGVHAVQWSVGSTPRYVACVAGSATREVYVGQSLSDDERSTRGVYKRVPVVSRICAIPEEYLLIAAADHCLTAAYRGECPGVDPDALMRWRAASRAAFQRRAVEAVLADVERAREALMDAPVVRLSPEPWEPACGVHGRTGACWQSGGPDPSVRTDACYAMGDPLLAVDMRGQYIPELPEAAARDGVCFIASLTERDGRIKVVCQSGTPTQIEAFMRVWAPAQGLTGIYGDPARGYAGGYAT